jgi:hypothetical protein
VVLVEGQTSVGGEADGQFPGSAASSANTSGPRKAQVKPSGRVLEPRKVLRIIALLLVVPLLGAQRPWVKSGFRDH